MPLANYTERLKSIEEESSMPPPSSRLSFECSQCGSSSRLKGTAKHKLRNASNNIKRVYKGYKARNVFRIKRGQDFEEKQLQFFHEMAIVIQK